ncbi:unnamed protein product [Ilex paraguariensis]|uniref:Cytochrome P450 n=1 Tax=Ilex paraguariensis TaxID=185542 RepID=A0ABC8TZP8_9AQUA
MVSWFMSWLNTSVPTNWPLIGMVPGLLRNAHRIHEYATEFLQETRGTFLFKGPWFSGMELLITCDPANVHHILSRNFSNYPKGPDYNQIFEPLGDGILNVDAELWETQRKITMSLMNHSKFQVSLERTSWQKVEKGLIPILERASELGGEVDMQDLLGRFTYDCVSILVLGYDPASLSTDLPPIPSGEAEEAMLYRHIFPKSIWKLQRWLQIGQEKKLSKVFETFHHLLSHSISMKREEQSKRRRNQAVQDQEESFDLITAFMDAYKGISGASGDSDKFLRDSLLSLLFAGRSATTAVLTWFFWLLATNPLVETKIREEIKAKVNVKDDEKWSLLKVEELNKLVYLHGALCESLRLFPPVPFQHKAPLMPDILPSGHRINKNTKTVMCFYSMGRMESIWGKDWREFKPERWISERGVIEHMQSFKFVAFNAGPRSCLGKEMSLVQMKIATVAILNKYHIHVVESHPITPRNSIVLQMKHGLKVRITKRSV